MSYSQDHIKYLKKQLKDCNKLPSKRGIWRPRKKCKRKFDRKISKAYKKLAKMEAKEQKNKNKILLIEQKQTKRKQLSDNVTKRQIARAEGKRDWKMSKYQAKGVGYANGVDVGSGTAQAISSAIQGGTKNIGGMFSNMFGGSGKMSNTVTDGISAIGGGIGGGITAKRPQVQDSKSGDDKFKLSPAMMGGGALALLLVGAIALKN